MPTKTPYREPGNRTCTELEEDLMKVQEELANTQSAKKCWKIGTISTMVALAVVLARQELKTRQSEWESNVNFSEQNTRQYSSVDCLIEARETACEVAREHSTGWWQPRDIGTQLVYNPCGDRKTIAITKIYFNDDFATFRELEENEEQTEIDNLY